MNFACKRDTENLIMCNDLILPLNAEFKLNQDTQEVS